MASHSDLTECLYQAYPLLRGAGGFTLAMSDRRRELTIVEPDTRLKRVSGTDKALLPSTSIIRVIRVNICARIE